MAKWIRDTTISVDDHTLDFSKLDLSNHSSRIWSLRASCISIIVLLMIFASLRLSVRALMVRRIFVDDVLILIATVFTIALAGLGYAATYHGLGTHIWLLGGFDAGSVYHEVEHVMKIFFIIQIFHTCAVSFTKFSIIASYLRFIPDEKFHVIMWVTGSITSSLLVTGILVPTFQCSPISGAWDFSVLGRKCIDNVLYLYANSAINAFTDILLTVLPWPFFWRLPLPIKQRIVLCLLLGGGLGACVTVFVRLAMMKNLKSLDFTYKSVPLLELAVAECGIGIILVSIPILRPLAVRLLPRLFQSQANASVQLPPHPDSCRRSSDNTLADAETQESKPDETNEHEARGRSKTSSFSATSNFPERAHNI